MNTVAIPSLAQPDARAFVEQHQPGLWRFLRMLGCDSQRADEHCQDAILAALHFGIAHLPTAEAARWLRRVGRNRFLAQLRQERRRPPTVSIDDLDEAWVALRGDEDGGASALAALCRCLLKLPARERELLARRYEQGQARVDMARDLGLREMGVKKALRRARERLRDCVMRTLAEAGDELPSGARNER
ncbi:MAG: RNA polymerase sigma factor [Planctomycetota bacterium]